ncbi:hypothetical protein KM1_066160 [Entamoeba histolytica HM-3:IMSS]|uniref:Peptidase S74 domain-containing protein n=1 Tax=Entamoeba histolytica HM-3:IMSS TaxID=885315 RepID=M7W6K1_ENTHI|nr:hypothetical protein KM1_066160 [Entamoeba histolytica HM-3:IMSS]
METQAKPRRKCWMCVFPGCTEPPKTRYNCYSHVWDAHLRHLNGEKEAYKRIKEEERKDAMKLCEMYVVYVDDSRGKKGGNSFEKNIQIENERGSSTMFVRQISETPLIPSLTHSINNLQTIQNYQQVQQNIRSPLVVSTSSSTSAQINSPINLPQQLTPSTIPIQQIEQANTTIAQGVSTDNSTLTNPLCLNGFIDFKQESENSNGFNSRNDLFTSPQQPQNEIPWDYLQSPSTPLTPTQMNGIIEKNEDFIRIERINENLKRLHVMGEIMAENGFLQRSDIRVKENIKPLVDSLNTVLQLTGTSFNYIGKKEEKLGFIAQEVKKVCPELVIEDDKGELAVDVIGVIPHLVEALKQIYENASSEQLSSNERYKELSESTQQMIKVVEEFRKEIQEKNDEEKETRKNKIDKMLFFNFSFGPAIVTLFASIFLTIFSIFVIFSLPEFPFMWGYCWFTTILSYLSLWNTRNELKVMWNGGPLILYFKHNNFISIYLFLLLAAIGITVSMIMGTIVLIVMVVYVSLFVLIGGLLIIMKGMYQLDFKVISSVLIVYLVSVVIVSYSLFITQPGYDCFINSPSTTNFELQLQLNTPIQRQTFSPIPWNCMKYEVKSSQKLPAGIKIGSVRTDVETVPYLYGTVTDFFPTTKVEMFLECASYVRLRCGVITMKVCDGRDKISCEDNQCNWCGNSCKATC